MVRHFRDVNPLPGLAGCQALICLTMALHPFALRGADAPAAVRFRLAVSQAIIGADVNEGDASLAMGAWRDAVVRQSGLLIDFSVDTLPQLVRAVREQRVDGFTLTTLEYVDVEKYASQALMVDDRNMNGGDDYLLLVHQDSSIRSIAALRGKTVNIYDNPRMCLAEIWLETLFAGANLGAPREFLGRLASFNKLSRVVLPVYFRQADACLVTRRGFSTMCELNPQLASKLRVVANSPKLIASVMAFHRDFAPEQRVRLQAALTDLNKTVAGQQALTLFESSQLVVVDSSVLRPSLELIKAHERLRLKTEAVRK